MSNITPAWLLHVTPDIQFSIGEHQAAEYIETPSLLPVPLAAEPCKHVILWRDNIVPVIDMNILFGNPVENIFKHIIVIAYQRQDNNPLEFAAFRLVSSPEKINVNDDDACELPEDYPENMKHSILSMFKYNNQITSIFDYAKLISPA